MFVTCNGRWQQHSQHLLSAGTIRCSCLADVHLALMRVAGFFLYTTTAASTRTLSHRIEIVTMMSNRWRHVASIEFKSNISKNNNLNKLNECEIFPPKTDDNNQKDHSHHNSINVMSMLLITYQARGRLSGYIFRFRVSNFAEFWAQLQRTMLWFRRNSSYCLLNGKQISRELIGIIYFKRKWCWWWWS